MSTVNNGYILFLYEDLLLIIRISYFSYVIFVVVYNVKIEHNENSRK